MNPAAIADWAEVCGALIALAGEPVVLVSHAERPWASATFRGARHDVVLEFAEGDHLGRCDRFVAAIDAGELRLSRGVLADLRATFVSHALKPEPRSTVTVELLLVAE